MLRFRLLKRAPEIRRLALVLAALLLASAPLLSQAQPARTFTCTASNTTVNFGAYDVVAGTTLDGTGSFSVTCTKSGAGGPQAVTYSVKLASTPRQLAPAAGPDRLAYSVYTDAARTQPWGDGTAGTTVFTGTMTVPGGSNTSVTSAPHTYYARIEPGGQDVSAAALYSQTLTVSPRPARAARDRARDRYRPMLSVSGRG